MSFAIESAAAFTRLASLIAFRNVSYVFSMILGIGVDFQKGTPGS